MDDLKLFSLVERVYEKYNKTHDQSEEAIEKRKTIIEVIVKIFKEVCEYESVSIDGIERDNYGGTSDIFFVGDKVIKLGKFRYTSKIPNNPYILRPLIRRYLPTGIYSEGLFVEVVERVETISRFQFPCHKLYDLYAKLRDMGIEWLDIDPSNVGVLRKDNKIYWKQDIEPSPSSVMLDGDPGDLILKKGDLVILDTDWIYKYEDVPQELFEEVDDEWTFINTAKLFRKKYEIDKERQNRQEQMTLLKRIREILKGNKKKK